MKILHVLETSIPELVGYTIRAKYIVENQKKNGMDPVVVTSPFFRNGNPETRKEEHDGITFYRTNFIRSPDKCVNKAGSYWTRLKMLYAYRRVIMDIVITESPDIIHAHSSYTNGIAANYASRKTGIPSIYEMRSLWGESAVIDEGLRVNSIKYRAVWHLEMNAIRNAKRVITISEGIRNEIVKRGIDGNKIDILPNGVDTGFFQAAEKDQHLLSQLGLADISVIGYIGSIRKLEGLSCLIEAFRNVNKKIPKTKLLIVGDGPELTNLKSLATEMGVKDNLIFTGLVPHDEVLSYYSIIDIFVFPRIDAKINQTVTPLKPLEAMSAGKVCIGSDVGGLREIIRDNCNGLLFRSGDGGDLSNKIFALISDRNLYDSLRHNGMEWVKKESDWKILIPRYRSIYRKSQDS